ncbi:MAG: hypothetical protein ACXADY_16205 [Candidatus Hodarchaeales archaeon]|jgi:hypothetical protein
MKEIVSQIRSVVAFCGLEVESIASRKIYVTLDLKSKSRFRKKIYHMGVSKSLNGILAAERELSRKFKNNILILDLVNYLPKPTFANVELFHDLDTLQDFLKE